MSKAPLSDIKSRNTSAYSDDGFQRAHKKTGKFPRFVAAHCRINLKILFDFTNNQQPLIGTTTKEPCEGKNIF